MTLLVVFAITAILGATYIYVSTRDEDRRQEWRRQSRASFLKG